MDPEETNSIDALLFGRLIENLMAKSLRESASVLPTSTAVEAARNSLVARLPENPYGTAAIIQHLACDVAPGLNSSSRSRHYYGFVTGGVTPAAGLADNFVTYYDQNVQVHLPDQSIATDVEDRALNMLCELLNLDPKDWPHRTFTTGATASNLLGLACGREAILQRTSLCIPGLSVGEVGLFECMRLANLDRIQILTTAPHSSLRKAASIVGLGRDSVIEIGWDHAPHRISIGKLEKYLVTPKTASIVVLSCGEVNTGFFATSSAHEIALIKDLCQKHSAWLHVDGAFGIMGRVLFPLKELSKVQDPDLRDRLKDELEYEYMSGCSGIELADSIAGDCHKLLNVPYDCGFFLSKHDRNAEAVFQNPNAAYLSSPGAAGIASPLNIGVENSRRFRALPVYATLLAYGREGYLKMMLRQMALVRQVARRIHESKYFELLPESDEPIEVRVKRLFIIVLFRAKNPILNAELVPRINATREIYVSRTLWDGSPATRIAVSNWQAQVTDVETVMGALECVLKNAAVPLQQLLTQ